MSNLPVVPIVKISQDEVEHFQLDPEIGWARPNFILRLIAKMAERHGRDGFATTAKTLHMTDDELHEIIRSGTCEVCLERLCWSILRIEALDNRKAGGDTYKPFVCMVPEARLEEAKAYVLTVRGGSAELPA